MYEKNTTQNKWGSGVETYGFTLFDDRSTMLKLSFLDNVLSLSLGFPEINAEGKRSFPQALRKNQIITDQRIVALDRRISKKLLPDAMAGKDSSVGVFTSKTHSELFEIIYRDGHFYAGFHRGLNEQNRPAESFIFAFPEEAVIDNYDPETGSMELIGTDSGFYSFFMTLKSFVDSQGKAEAHQARVANAFATKNQNDLLMSIATRVGATIPERYSGGGAKPAYGKAPSSSFTQPAPNASSVPPQSAPAPIQEGVMMEGDMGSFLGGDDEDIPF